MEPKRLTRSRDAKIGGVCGGLAEYFDMDPTIMRIIFVVVFFMGGASLLAYIIMWIVMPEKKLY